EHHRQQHNAPTPPKIYTHGNLLDKDNHCTSIAAAAHSAFDPKHRRNNLGQWVSGARVRGLGRQGLGGGAATAFALPTIAAPPPNPMSDHDLPPLTPTPPGLYRHYKGNWYEVL